MKIGNRSNTSYFYVRIMQQNNLSMEISTNERERLIVHILDSYSAYISNKYNFQSTILIQSSSLFFVVIFGN